MSEERSFPLKDIAKEYFESKYLYEEIKQGNHLRGKSGQKWNFDGVVTTQFGKFGVFIKDWNRSIGVNQVRLLEKACVDMEFKGGLLIGRNFSSHANTYGQAKGVQIITRSKLIYKNKYS